VKPTEIIQTVTTAIVTVVVVIGLFAIVAYQVVNHENVQVPDLVALLVGSIIGTYFGHANAVNGITAAGAAAVNAANAGVVAAQQAQVDATSTK